MPYLKKIVLHCVDGYTPRLDALVEEFVRDGVMYVSVVGKDCVRVEDIIDELVVGDGSQGHYILTASHPDESVEEAVLFAESLIGELAGPVHVLAA